MIGRGPSMQRMFDLLEMAARSGSSVLVEGETGTGKEMVATAIHEASPRAKGPLVRVSCASLSESLAESELFGHVRGAFTGAVTGRQGRFEAASGGTLVLDEIGDVSLTMQTKLLRALQEQVIERVGSNVAVPVDIRVVASTNRDLLAMCEEGRFRRDLYYRLSVIPVRVPPLRERREDVPLLVEHFVERMNTSQVRQVRGFTPEAMARLVAAPWPGNVRELEHAVEYAFVVSHGSVIEEGALPASVREGRPVSVLEGRPLGPRASTHARGPARADAKTILAALQFEGGNREETARHLGITRMTLWKWMRALGVVWPPGLPDASGSSASDIG
jgi:DNA-binding NtrC family response regulator